VEKHRAMADIGTIRVLDSRNNYRVGSNPTIIGNIMKCKYCNNKMKYIHTWNFVSKISGSNKDDIYLCETCLTMYGTLNNKWISQNIRRLK